MTEHSDVPRMLSAFLLVGILVFGGGAVPARAQSAEVVPAGTSVEVRTIEAIDAGSNTDGRVFPGVIEQDLVDSNGSVLIPRGSSVELLVRHLRDKTLVLDLDSIAVNGERYSFAAANAEAGAGTQIMHWGKRIDLPAESILTFHWTEPLRTGIADEGYLRNGIHFHPGYGNTAYEQGLCDGRSDAESGHPQEARGEQFRGHHDRDEYVAGYADGYQSYDSSANNRQKPGDPGSPWSILIDRNGNLTWQAPEKATIYVQVDDETPKLLACGQSGIQAAPWIEAGHRYVFFLQDANGNEVAWTEEDRR